MLLLRPHGETGAVVRFLTFAGGLRAGYVPGARSRARRALLTPGNRVRLQLRARAEGQLPTAQLEPVQSRALIAFDAGSAAMLHWLSALTAETLAENVPHPALATALDALLAGLGAGATASDRQIWLARYELLLLQEAGFGLDLGRCALGGPADDLGYVSPKTGRAVSRTKAEGQPWRHRLLPLPAFLLQPQQPTASELREALALSGFFLLRHWQFSATLKQLRARAISAGADRAAPSPSIAPSPSSSPSSCPGD